MFIQVAGIKVNGNRRNVLQIKLKLVLKTGWQASYKHLYC